MLFCNSSIKDFDPSLFKIDPIDGEQTVEFTYTTTDKVGIVSDPAKVTMPFKDLKISGKLFNDGNGDGNVNGTVISSADGSALYVSLVKGGTVVATKPLTSSGYEFNIADGVRPNKTYTVVLSDTSGSAVAHLPTDWNNNDGENINSVSVTGNDGSKDGVLTVNVVETDITLADFAINKKPLAVDVSTPTQVNPGSSATVAVTDLNISDSETEENLTVTITTLPTNATIYYDGEEVTSGQVIPNFSNLLLTIDPDAGEQTVEFSYTSTDAASTTSNPATVTMSFANIVISGTLFNDGNGNGDVDGTATNNADGTALHVSLVDASTGNLVASKPLNADGTYRFESIDDLMPNKEYMVILTDINNTKTPKLPTEWTNRDGEMIGLSGLDGDADGIVHVSLKEQDIPNINFGINKKPEAVTLNVPSQSNPGANIEVAVPSLEISDKEDGTPTTLVISQLPTNGTLYYDGVAVVLDANITNVDTSKFTFDPDHGDLTAEFKYKAIDNAGVESLEATVTMPFTDLKISGHLFNDGNGDGTINGDPISQPNNEQLYVTLLDKNGTAVASKLVNSDGTYSFGTSDGLFADTNYTVVLSTIENGTEASLPTNWTNNEGEHIGTDAGTDGTADGKITVAIERSNIEEVNFGINKKPEVGDVTEPLQLNPGTSVKVNVPNLSLSDNEDTTPTSVKIVTVPNNATVYYDGVAVTANQTIESFDNDLLTIDPRNGDQTVSFTYIGIDAAGDQSKEATVTMSFDGLEINGNIFNDGNHNETVDGIKISEINGTQLYVTLLEENGTVMASMPINADGSYGFDGEDGIVPNSKYQVILSTQSNSLAPSLVVNWNNADGEHIGTDAGLDELADGKINVSVLEEDVNEVNFGVNARPMAITYREIIQINPSGTTQVAVPKLEISDKEDGKPTTVIITQLPTNGTLYYNGVAVEENQTIEDVNTSKFTIDPNNGDLVTTFKYRSIDVTGYESEEASIVMPFDGLTISGEVFLDANGDFVINGYKLTSGYGIKLFATLIDANDVVVASVPVDSNGNYLFDDKVGIVPHSDYSIVLSNTEGSKVKQLPIGWEYTHPSKIRVAVGVSDKVKQNFGINGQPIASDVSGEKQLNPNGIIRVDVPALNIEDNEDGGKPTTVIIQTLPTEGTLYYDGKEVIAGEPIENFNNALLMVDPNDGEVTIKFNYTVIDDAGFESEPATVVMEFADTDSDGDGIPDGQDLDDDNDGILDTVEESTAGNNGDTDGDGIPDRLDLDSDGDGILDLEESNPNASEVDTDGNGVIDSKVDEDNDGVMDIVAGGVTPVDTDNDGTPDFQDVDSDNDGLSDLVEGGLDASLDTNNDGILDNQTDTDSDGIANVVDPDNGGTPATTPDTDNDGTDNYRDLDSDGDSILDVIEIGGTDSDADGQIDTASILISGINLPDSDANGTPDVLQALLVDDIKRAIAGEIVVIDLLANDTDNIDSSSVQLIIPDNFNGIARISEDRKRVVVDGEGEWSVDEKGILTFTPEVGFIGTPTPLRYSASNVNGSKVAEANISIILSETVVAGDTDIAEVCETYEDNVSIYSKWNIIFVILLSSIFGLFFFRREKA